MQTQPVKRKRAMRYIYIYMYVYDIKFGMLQVRENDISLRKWSGGAVQLRTLRETLLTAICLPLIECALLL